MKGKGGDRKRRRQEENETGREKDRKRMRQEEEETRRATLPSANMELKATSTNRTILNVVFYL